MPSKQPQNERKDSADQQTGDNRKVEAEVVFAVVDIAGQAAKPAFAEARPKESANSGKDQAGDNQKLSDILHIDTLLDHGHALEGFFDCAGGGLNTSEATVKAI